MSYAIIRSGGKQFPVTEGQTVRVPSIDGKEGDKVDIESLVAGGRRRRCNREGDCRRPRPRRKGHCFQEKTPQTVQTQTRPPSGIYRN